MSGLGPRNMGHGLDVAALRFADGITQPPASPDPVIYRVGLQLFLRDTAGTEHPVAVGADGLGVVALTVTQSPYAVQPTDRVLLVDTTDGAVTAKLPAAGGPFSGRPLLIIDARTKFGTHSFTLDGNGQTINGAATVVLSTDDASLAVVWGGTEWAIVASSAGLSTPFDPHRPGPLGDLVPSTMDANYFTLRSFVAPAAPALARVALYSEGGYGIAQRVSAGAAAGATLSDSMVAGTATAYVGRRYDVFSLANGATHDTTIGKGGIGRIAAVGATGSDGAPFTFGDNAATNLNGVTYTNVAAADTPGKLCVYASSGMLRVKNNLGVTARIILVTEEAIAV